MSEQQTRTGADKVELQASDFKLKDTYSWQEVLDIIAFLRTDQGCPWDRKQSHQSLRSNLIEEAYEAIEAIDDGEPDRLMDELGDNLLQVLLHSQIALEAGEFTIQDVLNNLGQKLIRRHTHVFGSDHAGTEAEALKSWQANKKVEKHQASAADSVEDIPKNLPALSRAYKAQKRAAAVGFDWAESDLDQIVDKIDEEFSELRAELAVRPDSPEAELEAGDLLFALVNYLRHLKIDPEIALNKATGKFQRRFRAVEDKARGLGQEITDLNYQELNDLWDQVKQAE